jgi:hypothetical protein
MGFTIDRCSLVAALKIIVLSKGEGAKFAGGPIAARRSATGAVDREQALRRRADAPRRALSQEGTQVPANRLGPKLLISNDPRRFGRTDRGSGSSLAGLPRRR